MSIMGSGHFSHPTAETVRGLLDELERESATLDERGRDDAVAVLQHGRSILDSGEPDLGALAGLLQEASRVCVIGRRPDLLDRRGWPRPVYDLFASYEENASGPWLHPTHDYPNAVSPVTKLLGFPVGIPFGVPASALTSNPTWIKFYADRGYNVLTFKTVRTSAHEAYPPPNWLFVDGYDTPLSPTNLPANPKATADLFTYPKDPTAFSTVNSFGVPSPSVEQWTRQVQECLRLLRPGQLLIVSVMGSPVDDLDALVEDFVECALAARDAGALAIELNLSCPNTMTPDGEIKRNLVCHSGEETLRVVQAVREALDQQTKLVAKLAYLPYQQLRDVVLPIAQHVDGISGINTYQVPTVEHYSGEASFVGHRGDDTYHREVAGLSGIAIRDLAVDFTRSLARMRTEDELSFDILAMGGVMTAEDVETLWDAGAACVQTASAAFVNWRLGLEVDARAANRFPTDPHRSSIAAAAESDLSVLRLVRAYGRLELLDLQGMTAFSTSELRDSIERLCERGELQIRSRYPTLVIDRRSFWSRRGASKQSA